MFQRPPRALLIRGYLFFAAAWALVMAALALESAGVRLLGSAAAGVIYLAAVSALMLLGAALLIAVWMRRGTLGERLATLPAVTVVALYHAILINGPG